MSSYTAYFIVEQNLAGIYAVVSDVTISSRPDNGRYGVVYFPKRRLDA